MTHDPTGVAGVEVLGDGGAAGERVLTPAALGFVALLQRELGPTRVALLQARQERQQELSQDRKSVV